ncbi:OmpA family protein [Flavihumibacter profundi]|jgi:chemotaxis protein MotB|uniref:OmpA family protein n=1 Tax=Flavihumibacter profundi TaxID=2716883 RepID=UPI001CC3528E|nr:OmpA family protein [Flavihumibacter profundi]MBZ5859126.1 OmpA family protein [Flavihumibacter profundi]
MKTRNIIVAMVLPFMLISCVSSKKYKTLQSQYTDSESRAKSLESSLSTCNSDKATLTSQKASLENENGLLNKRIEDLQSQNAFLKENSTQALSQLESMSVISKQQSESIKQSMENIGAKDAYIQTLQQQMAYKDSLNMALVMNLKGAIGNMDDKDINIKVDKGVVYIDISDKLLFKSGSYTVTDKAKAVLGKVAMVLKNQPDIEFMVEGHTDNVPYHRDVLLDNWDLSVKRATSVVRILQKDYGMTPAKISAAGRSEYRPLVDNNTKEGRALNRRTRIIILPELDQFFKLLEPAAKK